MRKTIKCSHCKKTYRVVEEGVIGKCPGCGAPLIPGPEMFLCSHCGKYHRWDQICTKEILWMHSENLVGRGHGP